MLPLSFKEFLTFYEFETEITIEEKFQRYLQFGGMPILKDYKVNIAVNQSKRFSGSQASIQHKDICSGLLSTNKNSTIICLLSK